MNRVDTLALCWRLERRDGAGLALTSHDRSLRVDGVDYRPSPGLLPASIRRSGGLAPASSDIDGAICAEALSEVDLALGRWSGAAIRLDAVVWDDPAKPAMALMRGEIGEVSVTDKGFSAELVGPTARLDEAVCPATSSECRAAFGDRRCRVDLAGRRALVTVTSSEGNRVQVDPVADDRFANGRMLILDGVCAGWSVPVVTVEDGVLMLRDFPRFAIEAGTRAWIEEGCDKRFETCRTRFSNALNFRGEPHLPGNDLLTRYPGG